MKKRTIFLKSIYAMAVTTLFLGLFTVNVLAGEPTLFTGTRALLTAVLGFFTGIVTLYFTFHGIKDVFAWKAAEIEEKPQKIKAIKSTVAGFILSLTIGGVLTWISTFYQ